MFKPVCPRMKENSPIWLEPAATTNAVRAGRGNGSTQAPATTNFPNTTRQVRINTGLMLSIK